MRKIVALAALVIAQIVIALFVIKNWFYVTTYRLYLDQRVGDVRYSTAVQRFDVEGRRIVPQIVTRDRERVAFAIAVNRPSMLHVSVRAEDRARYELHVHQDGRDELLARGDATSSASSVVAPLPTDPGVVELVSDLMLVVDPRGRLVDLNGASKRVFGFRAEDVLGEAVATVLPALAVFFSNGRSARASGSVSRTRNVGGSAMPSRPQVA